MKQKLLPLEQLFRLEGYAIIRYFPATQFSPEILSTKEHTKIDFQTLGPKKSSTGIQN